jgi:hypothetical protein
LNYLHLCVSSSFVQLEAHDSFCHSGSRLKPERGHASGTETMYALSLVPLCCRRMCRKRGLYTDASSSALAAQLHLLRRAQCRVGLRHAKFYDRASQVRPPHRLCLWVSE